MVVTSMMLSPLPRIRKLLIFVLGGCTIFTCFLGGIDLTGVLERYATVALHNDTSDSLLNKVTRAIVQTEDVEMGMTDPGVVESENNSDVSDQKYTGIATKPDAAETMATSAMSTFNDTNENGIKTTAKPPVNHTSAPNEEPRVKSILYWTAKYHEIWSEVEHTGMRPFRDCKYSQCAVHGDKSKLKEADMLLFFNLDKPDFPKPRNTSQLYVHIDRDPPRDPDATYLDEYHDQINLTANYRMDADIPMPHCTFQPIKPSPYKPRVAFAQKTGSVVWMVSHCVTPSMRHLYVKELSKYIDVDIYGRCGNFTCPKHTKCFETFEKKYKFYLSFENRFCKDYFTEKLHNPMNVELIPVTLGLANYAGIVPERSIVNAMDYKSPKELAEYLHYLSNNEAEYYKYFDWKGKLLKIQRVSFYCQICEALHTDKYKVDGVVQPSYKRSRQGTYREWWQGACKHDTMANLREAGGW